MVHTIKGHFTECCLFMPIENTNFISDMVLGRKMVINYSKETYKDKYSSNYNMYKFCYHKALYPYFNNLHYCSDYFLIIILITSTLFARAACGLCHVIKIFLSALSLAATSKHTI